MFGQNPIRSKTLESNILAVQSIFNTIQGEGPFSGCHAVFVRLAGCNLACTFCDTEFESGIDNQMQIFQVIKAIKQANGGEKMPKMVVMTGGEPLRQNIVFLMHQILDAGVELIQIETAGTIWQVGLDDLIKTGRVVLVCSPKTPGIHPSIAVYCNHWKYIIQAGKLSQVDGLPVEGVQPKTKGLPQNIYRPNLTAPHNVIWVSPCDEQDQTLNFMNRQAAVDACMKHDYRLSLQTHKILGVE